MKVLSLDGVWKLRGKQETKNGEVIALDGSVPGCVQLDLSREGYLPRDLYMGMNVTETEKFENYEWWYERKFECEYEKNVYLVFEGVDCIVKYFLNEYKIGESENMFISHEFRIDEYLVKGENTLTVHIKSATLAARNYDYPLKVLGASHSAEAKFIRKPPHSYGWDIMPRAVSAGLWRSVRIEERDDIYFKQKFVHAPGGSCSFYYELHSEITDLSGMEIEICGSCGDSTFYHRVRASQPFGFFRFTVKNPKFWFPYGYGEANVYDAFSKIYLDGRLIHEETMTFGIRQVKLDRRDPDGNNPGDFRFIINGTDIMCRGSNWVCLDAFHSRDKERYEEALSLVKDIGCNILRCWGGNVYEDTEFYDFCDRNGIMVWQDFSMACDIYPESDDFKANLKSEVIAVIRKLRSHPSIIVWSGDNEVDSLNPTYNPDKNTLTRVLIPKCIEENDIGRPYLPSSPYISGKMCESGFRSQGYGMPFVEDHLWGPRDYFKSDFYKTNQAAFVSETGYHGCPSLDSVRKFITPERVWPYKNNPEWILHSSDQNGNDSRVMLMEKQVRQLFGEVPTAPEEYVLASQISQAEAKKYFIERMRVSRPQKTGIIWWNLLDGWPQMSDAVVDYYFEKKLAYYYIKRSQAPFVIAADEISSWHIGIYACNDTLTKKSGHLTVKIADTEEVLYEGDFNARENASTLITRLPVYYSDRGMLIFEWSVDGERGFNHYVLGNPPLSLSAYKKMIEKYQLGR